MARLLITAGTSWFLATFWENFYRNHGYCNLQERLQENILGYVLFCMLVTAGTSLILGNSCGFGPQEATAFLVPASCRK